MPPGPDDPGQVVVVVEAAGVGRRSGVAQQQRTDVAFGFGLPDRLVEVDGAVQAEADVAVRVDQAGNDPSAAVEDGVRAADRLGGQHAVDDPPLHRLLIG